MLNKHKHEYEGTLMENLEDNSVIAYIELTGLIVNTLDTNRVSRKDSVQNLTYGQNNVTQVTRTNVITARFDDSKSNQPYRPALKKGNRVIAWRYSDSDDWYWYADDRDRSAKTTDRQRIQVPAKPKLNDEPLNDDNTYFIETNSEEGHITIKTSSANGEKYRYTITITTKGDGSQGISVGDGENTFSINSDRQTVSMTNSAKSSISLIGQNINILCEGSVTINAKEHIRTKSTFFSVTASDGIGLIGKTINIIGSNILSLISKSLSFASSSGGGGMSITGNKLWSTYDIEAPNFSADGEIKAKSIKGSSVQDNQSAPKLRHDRPKQAPKIPGQESK